MQIFGKTFPNEEDTMKKIFATAAIGVALFAGMTTAASAGCSCTIKKNCSHGGYAYIKKYKKVAVTCYKKRTFQVPTKCVEVNTCQRMTCYKTKTEMVKSRCYKVVPYMKKVWVDSSATIK